MFLSMVALGLRYCLDIFLVGESRLLVAGAPLVVVTGSGCEASVAAALGLSSCGAWAYMLRGVWDLPGLGKEPLSPTLTGRF